MSAFAGMSTPQLQQALLDSQLALIALVTGGKPQVVAYGNGEGQRAVTYTRTNEAQLRAMIRELQTAMGTGPRRRAIGVRFA